MSHLFCTTSFFQAETVICFLILDCVHCLVETCDGRIWSEIHNSERQNVWSVFLEQRVAVIGLGAGYPYRLLDEPYRWRWRFTMSYKVQTEKTSSTRTLKDSPWQTIWSTYPCPCVYRCYHADFNECTHQAERKLNPDRETDTNAVLHSVHKLAKHRKLLAAIHSSST